MPDEEILRRLLMLNLSMRPTLPFSRREPVEGTDEAKAGNPKHIQWTGHLAQNVRDHLGIQRRGLQLLVTAQDFDHTGIHRLLQQMRHSYGTHALFRDFNEFAHFGIHRFLHLTHSFAPFWWPFVRQRSSADAGPGLILCAHDIHFEQRHRY